MTSDECAAPIKRETPPTVIDTEHVKGTIQSQGVRWNGTADGRVRAEHWSGDVMLDLGCMSEDEVDASVSAYFDGDSAREFGDALRENDGGTWETENCTIWLDRGWLHHEGPLRRETDHQATVSLNFEGDHCRAELVYEGEDGDGVVTVATDLSSDEREALAAALEYSAEQADEYVPRTSSATKDSSRSRAKAFASMAIPTGITLGIAYGVMVKLGSQLGADFTVNSEPVSFTPDPVAFLGVGTLAVFMLWAIQYLPGHVGGLHR